jgi:hypothetical protein
MLSRKSGGVPDIVIRESLNITTEGKTMIFHLYGLEESLYNGWCNESAEVY